MRFVNYDKKTGDVLGFYNPAYDYPNGIPVPNIEITDQQHQEYFAKGQRHKVLKQSDETLVFVYVEPEPLSKEELQAADIAALDAEYQPQFAGLAQSLGLATLDGNQNVIDSIKADYAAIKTEYQTKKEEIVNG